MNKKEIEFFYVYEKRGKTAPKDILENELWVDVGNRAADGVLDHHQEEGKNSAFSVVLEKVDCYNRVKEYVRETEKKLKKPEIYFHVHELPDIDCIAGTYVIQQMLCQGREDPKEAIIDTVEKLEEYINIIDQGKGMMPRVTLYAYICKIGMGIEDEKARSKAIMTEGLKVFGLVVNELEKKAQEGALEEPDIEIELDDYRSYHRSKRSSLETAK